MDVHFLFLVGLTISDFIMENGAIDCNNPIFNCALAIVIDCQPLKYTANKLFIFISPFFIKINTRENNAITARENNPNTLSTSTDDNMSEILELYFEARYALIASGATLEGKKLPEKVPKKYILTI